VSVPFAVVRLGVGRSLPITLKDGLGVVDHQPGCGRGLRLFDRLQSFLRRRKLGIQTIGFGLIRDKSARLNLSHGQRPFVPSTDIFLALAVEHLGAAKDPG